MRETLLAWILLSAALAGCLGSDPADELPDQGPDEIVNDTTWAADALPFGENHSHTDPSQHTGLSTPNFEVLGYDPLETGYHGATSGDYLCGEVATEGERDIAVTHSFGTDVAFVTVDVTDPANPRKVGEMALPYSHTYDVAVTSDATYVALAVSGADTGPDDEQGSARAPRAMDDPSSTAEASNAGVLTFEHRTACGTTVQETHEVPYQSGVVLVDISDPGSPQVVDYLAQPVLGPHSIFATTIDGTHHLLASTTNLAHTASYFTFLTIDETPFGPRLVEQHQYTAQYPGQSGEEPALVNGHVDGWIAEHPVTGTTVAYLANWNGGLHVLERSGPADTWQRVAVWNDYAPSAGAGMTGQIHGALPMSDTWNGTHYTFIGQEVGSRPAERPTGQVIMLDTTDPADPTPVARWTLPTDVEFDASLQFSTHYFAVVDRTLFVSLYHGGVWAVGTEPIEGTHQLPSKGVFVPDRSPPNPPPEHLSIFRWTPIVLDVLDLPTGELVVFDGTSGAYTVSFDEAHEVPIPDPWTADPWVGDRDTRTAGPLPGAPGPR